MKFSETPENIRNSRIGYIDRRWLQLNTLLKDYSDRAMKFLLLTNSGGAIAVLSFMGTSEIVRQLEAPKFALAFYIFGVVLSGVLNAFVVHRVDHLLNSWMKDIERYYEDEIDWEDLTSLDDDRSWGSNSEYCIGYGSFFCFIVGSIIGIYQFF